MGATRDPNPNHDMRGTQSSIMTCVLLSTSTIPLPLQRRVRVTGGVTVRGRVTVRVTVRGTVTVTVTVTVAVTVIP